MATAADIGKWARVGTNPANQRQLITSGTGVLTRDPDTQRVRISCVYCVCRVAKKSPSKRLLPNRELSHPSVIL